MKTASYFVSLLITLHFLFFGEVFVHNAGAQNMAGGYYHSMFLCADGTVSTCGYNIHGQLGNGNNLTSATPVTVANLTDVIAIGCGRFYSMAIKNDSTLWIWGSNDNYQLANGDQINVNSPIQVAGLSSVKAVDGSIHGIALKNDGTVWTWGVNGVGQMGNGSTSTPIQTPTQVAGMSDVIAVEASTERCMVLKSDSTVWTWGHGFYGALGNGFNTYSLSPMQIADLTGVVDIATSDLNSYALKADGTVWACGWNEQGALGNGNYDDGYYMAQIPDLSDIISIDDGASFAMFLKNDGTVWAVGDNSNGNLGIGSNVENSNTVVQVTGLNNIVAIECGTFHTLALRNDDTVWAWGWNIENQLGNDNGNSSNVPVQLTGLCSMITGIEEENQSNQSLVVYPNPANDQITIRLENDTLGNVDLLSIIDRTGKVVWQSTQANQITSIDVEYLSEGVYTLVVQQGNSVSHQSFVKIK